MGIYDPILQANQHGLDQNFALQQQRLQTPTMADVFMERLQQGQKMALQRQQLQALMGYRNAMIDERQGFHQGMIQNGMDRNQNAADRNDIVANNYDTNNAIKQQLMDPRIQKLLADAGYKQAQTAEVAPNAESKRALEGAQAGLAGARTTSEPIKAQAALLGGEGRKEFGDKYQPNPGSNSVSVGSGASSMSVPEKLLENINNTARSNFNSYVNSIQGIKDAAAGKLRKYEDFQQEVVNGLLNLQGGTVKAPVVQPTGQTQPAAQPKSLVGQATTKPDGTYHMNGKTYTVKSGKIVSEA